MEEHPAVSGIAPQARDLEELHIPTGQIREVPRHSFLRSHYGRIESAKRSQSHRTVQGSSKLLGRARYDDLPDVVAIPPCRSGKFQERLNNYGAAGFVAEGSQSHRYRSGKFQASSKRLAPQSQGCAHHTVRGVAHSTINRLQGSNSVSRIRLRTVRQEGDDPDFLDSAGTLIPPQSHHTDQGSSKYALAFTGPPERLREVATPPYRSGKFQDCFEVEFTLGC